MKVSVGVFQSLYCLSREFGLLWQAADIPCTSAEGFLTLLCLILYAAAAKHALQALLCPALLS